MTLEELEALCDAATPESWTLKVETEKQGGEEFGLHISIPEIDRCLHDFEWAESEDWNRDLANAQAIVAAHNELPRLVALLKEAAGWLTPAMIAIGTSGADKNLEAVKEIRKLLDKIHGEI